jgi:hypothetical protein
MCGVESCLARTLRRICGAKMSVRGRDYERGPSKQSPIGSADLERLEATRRPRDIERVEGVLGRELGDGLTRSGPLAAT